MAGYAGCFTGTVRPYFRDPYDGYEKAEELMFPVQFRAAGFHPKERVLGVKIDGQSKAYPFVELDKTSGTVVDRIGNTALTIRFDRDAKRATAHAKDGQQLAAVVGYWFAWYTFNPGTAVFRAGEAPKPRQQPSGCRIASTDSRRACKKTVPGPTKYNKDK